MVLACDSGSCFPPGGGKEEVGRAPDELLKTRIRGGSRKTGFKKEENGGVLCRGK